jgi:hypothetical protein
MEGSRVIDTSLFPYEKFGFRLEFGEKKNITVCWFECQEHLDKYLERYKLDKRTIKIDYRDGEPVSPSKRNKRSVEQTPKPKSNGGSSTIRKRKSSMDSTRNTTSPTKRKK